MGLFGKIVGGLGHAVRKIGQFGAAGLSKIGQIKNVYDKVNNATDGLIGDTLERLPVVGAAFSHAGNFLKDKDKVAGLAKGLDKANVIGGALEDYGARH